MRIEADRDFGARECPSCAVEVAANHNRCPICGYEFPNERPGQKRFRTAVALILLAALLVGWIALR